MKKSILIVAAALILFLVQLLPAAAAQVDANGNPLPPGEAPAGSEEQGPELAKQLQSPVASLISVPFQNNFEFNLGRNDDGFKYTLNFQPVIPLSLGEDWNLTVRTILPIISQDDVIPDSWESNLGDHDDDRANFYTSPIW